ncbi:MAG: MgtC/SapB family protein, partial [Sedimentisphaerales bacterium]|nr:MgtC/SapB family protein [Sedimentisphaerales bacterium]
LYLSDIYKTVYTMDPTRMITGVVQGIGFLCGGAILQAGATSVRGLTTAATLWIVSGIGIAVGAGDYASAIMVTVVVMLVLVVVRRLEISIHGRKHPDH